MRSARTALVAAVAAAVATGLGAGPAAAEDIHVSPGRPHPGQRIHISVPGCSVGPTPHTAKSDAFTHDITLYGKADTGEGDPRIKKGLRPGTYPVTAFCGSGRTLLGQIVVVAKAGKAAPGGEPATRLPNAHTESAGPRSPGTISATPAASQSDRGSNAPFYVIGGVMAALVVGAGTLLAVRRRAR